MERVVSEHGFRMVFLIRLSPVVPFALTNYSLGVTRVRFWRYVGASFVGMLPGAFLYSYLGSTLQVLTRAAAPGEEASTAKSVLFWAGLVATLVVTVLLTRISGVPLLEHRADARWGDDPAYRAYKARTPVLVPWPRGR